jgi:hypothetical protein
LWYGDHNGIPIITNQTGQYVLDRGGRAIREEYIAGGRLVSIPRGDEFRHIVAELANSLRIGIRAGARGPNCRPHLKGAFNHIGRECGCDAGIAYAELVRQIAQGEDLTVIRDRPLSHRVGIADVRVYYFPTLGGHWYEYIALVEKRERDATRVSFLGRAEIFPIQTKTCRREMGRSRHFEA